VFRQHRPSPLLLVVVVFLFFFFIIFVVFVIELVIELELVIIELVVVIQIVFEFVVFVIELVVIQFFVIEFEVVVEFVVIGWHVALHPDIAGGDAGIIAPDRGQLNHDPGEDVKPAVLAGNHLPPPVVLVVRPPAVHRRHRLEAPALRQSSGGASFTVKTSTPSGP
jgi:hypothetical protein